MMRALKALAVVAAVALMPASAWAQGSVAGVVKDTSGAVLPGATVEVASPALIEKTRSAVTDGTGQYQITNLIAGTYSVTFTLTGFNTVKREGIELTGSFTAKVDAELRVGALEETITVTGETPVVDVQSTTRERVIGREIIDSIPSGRTAYTMAVLIPGVTPGSNSNQDVGGSAGNGNAIGSVAIHGGRTQDQTVLRNGISAVGQASAGFSTPININPVGTQEVNVDTASASAEASTGGIRINVIPREGANRFTGAFFGGYTSPAWQGNNFTDELRRRGLAGNPDKIKNNYDINPGFGGPLKRDKVWFFTAARYFNSQNYVADMYFDKNAANPKAFTWDPDLSRRAYNVSIWKGAQLRLTWQAGAKNKIGISWHEDSLNYSPTTVSKTLAPEAALWRLYPLQRQIQVDWSSPISNRLLLEAAENFYNAASDINNMPGLPIGTIPVVEQSIGLSFKGQDTNRAAPTQSLHIRVAASYVTGAHAFKVGLNHTKGWNKFKNDNLSPVSYRLNNGIPNQLSVRAFPINTETDMEHNVGAFAQDRWTVNRLTATAGLRWDYISVGWPEQHVGPGPLAPTRDVTYPAVSGNLTWNDLTPHLGAVYDLFGNGKTALKVSLNKYLENIAAGAAIATDPNPINSLITQTTRSWNDANRNLVPDCDLINPLANGECGTMANTNFGKLVPGATYDPDLMHGWNHRGSNWEFSTGVQHEVMPRTSVDVSYFRRMYGNFRVTDNRALAASDFDKFDVIAPKDPRLPGGGGYVLAGMYNLNPSKVGVPSDNFITLASNYAGQTEYWHGVDVNLSARFGSGLLVQGGTSTGRTVKDDCDILANVPEPAETRSSSTGLVSQMPQSTIAPPLAYCHNATNWLTQVKFLGSYTIPRVDVLVSGTFQSIPGREILANYALPTAIAAQTLGRPLSGGAANVTVNLVRPGSLYNDRLNQVDLRFGKVLRYARTRSAVSLDLYNALNSNPALNQNNTFNPNNAVWQTPSQILPARFAKVSVQFDF